MKVMKVIILCERCPYSELFRSVLNSENTERYGVNMEEYGPE